MRRRRTSRVLSGRRLVAQVTSRSRLCFIVGDFLPIQLIYQGKTASCHPRFELPPKWDITHSAKHCSNETTMIHYIEKIIIPYISKVRESAGSNTPAMIIMDNFKGQSPLQWTVFWMQTAFMFASSLPTLPRLPPTTRHLHKLTCKGFFKRKFEDWYSNDIMKQLEGREIESAELQPINLGMPVMKELDARWMVEMAAYLARTPRQ